ncbi:CBS domain-containing protein [Candidatus Pacearchaeota archaeon]|nr:CBS domain-containing protein [Candidatus Pacearchaeota archaeon]
MESRIRVGDVMTRNFVHVKPETKLIDCARTMIKNRVGSLVVKENEELHGIVTEKDIVWALTKKANNGFENIAVRDIARKKIITIKPEAGIHEALDKMNKFKIRRMPVISNKKIIGYVTLKDIVKFLPEVFESTREFEKIKEETNKMQKSESSMQGMFHEDLCEECGNYDILTRIDGRMICESCRDEM